MAKHAGGRPPMYKTKKEIQEKIDAYFEECKGRVLTDPDGNVLTDKSGRPIIVDERPLKPTIEVRTMSILSLDTRSQTDCIPANTFI